MPAFIDSFATQHVLPPYGAVGVRTHVFVFRLSIQRVQAYCDKYLNLGDVAARPYHYVAVPESALGILAISDYPSLRSLTPDDHGGLRGRDEDRVGPTWDNVPQKELFAAAPVRRYRVVAGGVLVDPVLQWVQPFLVNDNSSAAFAGREVLGLETLWGPVHIDISSSGALEVCTRLPSWRVFSRDTPQKLLTFFWADTGAPLDRDAIAARADAVASNPESVADMSVLAEGLALGRLARDMSMVILKQFRAADDPTAAIYQALVAADCHFEDIRDIDLYAEEECKVEFTTGAMVNEIISTLVDESVARLDASQRNDILGDETRHLQVRLAFSFTSNVRFDAIQTLHEFPMT